MEGRFLIERADFLIAERSGKYEYMKTSVSSMRRVRKYLPP
jgi:hypothetical protein